MRRSDNRGDEFVDATVRVHAGSAKALLLSRPQDHESSAVWVPKSQTNYTGRPQNGDILTMGIKEWFLKKENILDWGDD